MTIDAVVTHHRDRFRSGVASFNELLANGLGVPLVGLDAIGESGRPLLSFKVRELGDAERETVARAIEQPSLGWSVFLHDFSGDPLEHAIVERAAVVYCGNREIEARVAGLNARCETLWAPGLLLDHRPLRTAEISVFSFGMAHKLRTEMFHRLAGLLDALGKDYALYVSAASHETSSMRDSETVFREMHELFPETLYFLGNLSDVAVWHYLGACTYYAAFFPGGVRANNTSVASALERGAVVVTNLDEWSPPELVHMENVIDIEQCTRLPDDPEVLRSLSERARETAAPRSWAALVARIRGLESC